MDEVYENAEEVLGCRRKSKREHQTVEYICMNHEVIQTVQRKTTGPSPPGPEILKKSSCRAAVILLGLLCLFLLVGLITVVFLFTQGKSQWEMKTVILHKLYDNVTSERNQLQTSFNNLVKERDQLQKRLEDMTTSRDDLQYRREKVIFSDSLYQVSSEKKSWQESRQDCLQKGADLMIINSREEQNFVNEFKKNLWIGLTDSEREGTWKWVDGTQTSTSYWNQGNKEPNGGTWQNCGEIDNYNIEDSWNDAPCSNRQFWICEKRVSP
ncbi:CD209 antigen-like protein C [Astatotilapia calliptera]|uniref:CD209 antigen-like protein C n=1 Tax=Astatotilapia calliptera TaxID=8154 RepID=UPI000E41EAFE|nr:CD209 antigen-like protein C [Astatotilapia calliptera]